MLPARAWMLCCLIGASLVAVRVALQPFAGEPWQAHATDILSLLRSLLATAALAWAALRTATWSWRLLVAAGTAWSMAEVIWLVLAFMGDQPWASAADAFFLLFYPCLLIGILLLPRQHPRGGGAWAAGLDVAVIITAAGAAMWLLLVGPGLPAEGGIGLKQVIAIAYPVGDLLLLWAACDLLFRGQVRTARGVAQLLVGGAACLISADLLFAVQMLQGTYVSGNPLGIVWMAALVLIGLAGARQATAGEVPVRPAVPPRMTTAMLAAVALLALLALLVAHPGEHSALIAAGLGVILVLVRQLHALVVNRRLEEDLQRANGELEQRVAQRTAELARAQQRLVEAERMEAIGRVAGAIAHDFNNILTAVSGHAELARMRVADPTVQEHLDQTLGAVQRAGELARRLMATARPADGGALVPTDIAAIATEVAGQIHGALPGGIALAVEVPPGGVTVPGDGMQLHQMLMNLCANARDAMPDGGRLGIRILPEGGRVAVEVSDTGCGIDERVRSRLFEPYFTTKPGRGNGLGLATVHAIARRHGGTVEVDSAPGRGSVFRIRLPTG